MAKQKQAPAKELQMRMHCEVAQQIRQHCHTTTKAEVCGVLIGSEEDGVTTVEAAIAGKNAVQGGTHVTFTQDTWEHIYKIKDRDYPDHRIVGWYHSHPGFGVFLSEHDTFIHQNFFSSPQQVAWVYDPHSEEEGCFAWNGKRLERLTQFALVDEKGGEVAGKDGRAEPMMAASDEDEEEAKPKQKAKPVDSSKKQSSLLDWASTVLGGLSLFLLGALIVYFLFPRPVFITINPVTGELIEVSRSQIEELSKLLQEQMKLRPSPLNPPATNQKGKP